ncbi:MAG: glycosyltransferase family 4 protein [Sphingobacteriales bacterium]|jgi:glycosyltransferase involved in cell wall biosynthesis|nr:glycosyltransferase family 4 protein [Sphingobacteriales bacterium]
MTYLSARKKIKIERILISPLVLLGRIIGFFSPLKTKHQTILFFSSADIGGAPKVNADITNCIKELKPLIIFSKRPKNNQFAHLFEIEGVRIMDLHNWIDNKLYHFVNIIFRGIIASWIRQQKMKFIFGGECIYFYKVIPYAGKTVKRIELCHLDTWLGYSIGFVDFIDLRIFSTKALMRKVERQYRENYLSVKFSDRLLFIENFIDIPEYELHQNEKLQVLFVGRGASQKRVHLIAAIAEKMQRAGDSVHFSFIGDVDNVIQTADYPFCTFYGNIKDQDYLNSIYKKSDVLILTSAYEGLPVVVMQMMAYGKIIVSTAVDGIPDYVRHNENGLLITATEESEIIDQGAELLRILINDITLIEKFGQKSRALAQSLFSEEVFRRSYRSVFGVTLN